MHYTDKNYAGELNFVHLILYVIIHKFNIL